MNSKHKAHCQPCNKLSTQMGESALRSLGQGEGHKKQEKVMSRTYVNLSQVKRETAMTPQLITFGSKRVHCDISWQKLSF